MSKIYNSIGSLSTLKLKLKENNINDFTSLNEVIDFYKSYSFYVQKIKNEHKFMIEKEKHELASQLHELHNILELTKIKVKDFLLNEINHYNNQLVKINKEESNSFFSKLIVTIKKWYLKIVLLYKEQNFNKKIKNKTRLLDKNILIKNKRYSFICTHFNKAVEESAQKSLTEIKQKKAIVDNLISYAYGALGEQKVLKKLETLSDDFVVINDFSISLKNPIYNKKKKDYIKSIQIDHLLVGPSGLFIIETKNWNENSLMNLNLHSPVEQILRTNHVLFKLLNNRDSSTQIKLNKHHWGDKKINIRNLIVFLTIKPRHEFQFVKILTLYELINYVNYFKPIYTKNEVNEITNFLLDISRKREN